MTALTTHVLDIARGVPAEGIAIALFLTGGGTRTFVGETTTNADGRTAEPIGRDLAAGTYELVFAAGDYLTRTAEAAFYDEITIRFKLDGRLPRLHVPLLLAPWGYSTYRGS